MWNLLLLGDSNFFHEVDTSSWCMSYFCTQNESVASIIQKAFKDPVVPNRLQVPPPYIGLHSMVGYPDVYPLYSVKVGHADRARLKTVKHLMDQIKESTIVVIWIGQHDTWHIASSMQYSLEEKIEKIKEVGQSFACMINDLDFLHVVYVGYHDNSNMNAQQVYKQLNGILINTLLQNTKYSHLIPAPVIEDSAFVDSTHVNGVTKHLIAKHVMDNLWDIISRDIEFNVAYNTSDTRPSSSDPWADDTDPWAS